MKIRYIINKGFITQRINNKTTIFSGTESVLHTLNDAAAYIFQGLKLGWDRGKIVEGLVVKYGASSQQANEDFESFTKLLLEKKILIESS